MERLGLTLRAAVVIGALAMPGVAAPSASAVMFVGACPNFTGNANFGGHVGITPTDTNFVLYFECNAVVAGGPSTVKGTKQISFHATAPLDWCNGSSAGTGNIAGSSLAPISGTFAFTKTPNHYELTGEFTKGWRKVTVHVSGDLTSHSPGPCHYNTAVFSGRATFHEVMQPVAGFTGVVRGQMITSPGWSPATQTPQSFAMSGMAVGVIGGVPTECSVSFAGSSTGGETLAAGAGTVSGGCNGPGVSANCTGEYVRTGAVMQILADCPDFVDGVLVASIALQPENAIPTTNAAFAGSLSVH